MPHSRLRRELCMPLNYCTSSATAELGVIYLAFKVFLYHPHPSGVFDMADSRAALLRLQNARNATMFTREVIHNVAKAIHLSKAASVFFS